MLRGAIHLPSLLAERFESEIQEFLKSMGLRHVRGGRLAKIGGIQIDAGGGIGDTYVVVDCHTSVENRRRSVRNKIKEIRGVRYDLSRGLRDDRALSRYSKLRLVLCTKNIDVSPVDRVFARRRPIVHLWDEDFVAYYLQLAQKVGDYALYSLLGELDVEATAELPEEYFRVPAFKTVVRGRSLFSFWANPEVLLRIAFVARREVGREDYYQRLLKKDRLASIAKYISDERRKTLFPNAIILNFQSRPKFIPMRLAKSRVRCQYGWLNLPHEYRSAWVIDGQHRLYSFARSKAARKRILHPVVAFSNLPEDKQAEFFLTINKEQRPVDPNLLWDLEATVHPNTPAGIIANAVRNLEKDGALEGLVSYPLLGSRGQGRPLKLANVCDSIQARGLVEPQTEHMTRSMRNPLYAPSSRRRLEKLEDGLSEFFKALSEVFHDDWERGKNGFVCTNNGMAVLLRVFERYLVFRPKRPRQTHIVEVLKPLADLYFKEYHTPDKAKELRTSSSSEGSRGLVADEFSSVIRRKSKSFATDVEIAPPLEVRFAEFERKLKDAIVERIGSSLQEWWASVPEKLRSRAEGRRPGKPEPWLRLLLGELKDIFAQEEFWNTYLRHACEGIFDDRIKFVNHFGELVDLRNASQHGGTLTEHQAEASEFYLREFEKFLKRLSFSATTEIQAAVAFWMTPVKSDEDGTAENVVRTLVGELWIYAFGDRTPGRKHMKLGDWICFYVVGRGVAAHAKLSTSPKWEPHPRVRRPEHHPWTVKLDSPSLYLDFPVAIDSAKRKELDAFRGRRPKKDWAWFVQATRRVSEHDFKKLTRQAAET